MALQVENHRLFCDFSGVALSVVMLVWMTACAGCGDPGGGDPCDPSGASWMEVRHADQSVGVDLGILPGQRRGDLCLVPLDRIVEEAGLGIDLESSLFDFEGKDGFRPSQVDCPPLDGATLSKGWADMGTGTLVWDEKLGLRGCYSVTDAVAILALDAR